MTDDALIPCPFLTSRGVVDKDADGEREALRSSFSVRSLEIVVRACASSEGALLLPTGGEDIGGGAGGEVGQG